MRFHAKNELKAGYIRKHFPRFAADQIRSEDKISFQSYLSLHTGIFPTKSLKAIYHLYTVKEPSLIELNYPYTLDFLESKK